MIERLTSDSRRAAPGVAFFAWPGEAGDGRRFIEQAIARGAAAVLWESEGFGWRADWQVPNAPLKGLKQAAGFLAHEFYGRPSESLWVCGVTGTNGKTSCSQWLAALLGEHGDKTGVVGTLGAGFPGALAGGANTTPDALELHATLAEMRRAGARAVAMEVSSHGLEQGRVNGVAFDCALFTNLSHEHLDYHGTMQAYAEAKARLFEPFSASTGSGKGLGLSSVYGIVKQSDGYIQVQSEPGGGTTFQIFLPRVDRAAAGVRPVPLERLRGSETVLVVEDEALVLDLVREVLTGYGYTVLAAAHGEEGLRVLSSHPGPIHLLLTDVVLPMMGGTDLAERAAALRPETRILFMSGHPEDTVIRHGVPGRPGEYLQKPFNPDAVARKVRETLDAPRAA